jgi:hypothetical protein
MSTHYNQLFTQTFEQLGYNVVYQPSCLINNYDQKCWPINFPDVKWTDSTLVVMHCQDFVSIRNGECPELIAIEKHFADRASQVVVVHWNMDLDKVYSGPMTLLHFPTHSYELLLNLNANREDWLPAFDKTRTKIWQCLNGIPRKHRKLVAEYLQKFYSNGVLSLGTIIPLPKWNYNTYFGCENELNWLRLLPVYSDCDVNIVTETQYYESPGIISEKILMAFLGLQVPILIGYPGIITHCEQLGFDMFRDVVDTDYEFTNDDNRWKQALYLNSYLLNKGIDRDQLHSRLLSNQQHALNLPKMLVGNFTNRVSTNFPNLYTG